MIIANYKQYLLIFGKLQIHILKKWLLNKLLILSKNIKLKNIWNILFLIIPLIIIIVLKLFLI